METLAVKPKVKIVSTLNRLLGVASIHSNSAVSRKVTKYEVEIL
jgi:hypothetical protein